MKILLQRLQKAFSLTHDLAFSLEPEELQLKLKNLPSNTIGQQLWCIVGARESYLRAIINEGWSGFSCSLMDTTAKEKVLQALDKSADECLSFLQDCEINEKQEVWVFTLLEHELQHHGQLIRYCYGNKISFPMSWNERYTV